MAKPTGSLLKKLRTLMKNTQFVPEVIHAYIVPSGDAHQSEYIAPGFKRREYISGFSGSAGTAIITANKALLWTDGRYFQQAEKELDDNWTLMRDGLPETPSQEVWLSKELPPGARVGVDPFLVSLDYWRRLSGPVQAAGKALVRVDKNLIDIVWAEDGQPPPPSNEVFPLDLCYAGKSWEGKVKMIQGKLKERGASAFVVSALDEVAWLFNLRGSDIDFNPVFMSYAIVTLDGAKLFINAEQLTKTIRDHLTNEHENMKLEIYAYDEIGTEVKKIGDNGGKVWISSRSSAALASLVPVDHLITDLSPVCIAKAVKNQVEIEGMRRSHIRDAAALCEYFSWLESAIHKGQYSESDGADMLESFRKEQKDYVSLSFETISASGSNGSIIHYRPDAKASRLMSADEMYLCDSGAQYLDGTTDVTRTLHFGKPSDFEKECFTRVLKGHIQLSMAVFPKGTRGHVLDILARKPLWDCGLDYLHGTGHGVGSFLNVHEGPHGISPRRSDDEPLESGMFVTNEPGFYQNGEFGIRIENVMLVKQVNLKHNFQDREYLGLEPITLVPIQTKMIVPSMLSADEVAWLNDYHATCFENVAPLLAEENKHKALKWLKQETEQIG